MAPRSVGGLPIWAWGAAIAVGIGGFAWVKRGSAKSSGTSSPKAGPGGAVPFTQAQEVQDFQIFSALTSAQQGADLNMLSEVAGLFSGGPSTSATGAGSGSVGGGGGGSTGVSTIPSPTPTGSAPPTTVPVSSLKPTSIPATPPASSEPGYGANFGQLQALNPGLVPGDPRYQGTYNGVPL